MKYNLLTFFIIFTITFKAQLKVTKVATLPIKVTNNAVCEGFIDGKPFLFSYNKE